MGSSAMLLPTSICHQQPSSSSSSFYRRPSNNRKLPRLRRCSVFPFARLFEPATFEASKLKVLFLGIDDRKHPEMLPRTYTFTHSDLTACLTLTVSQSINRAQLKGWYNTLQRDEVVAEWRKLRGKMSLHVHCHISGGHFLLDLLANLRHRIFSKELPVVLKAFVHGDGSFFRSYPELEEALVWAYFHSKCPELNRVECWGPLREAAETGRPMKTGNRDVWRRKPEPQQRCEDECECCYPTHTLVPWSSKTEERAGLIWPFDIALDSFPANELE